MLRRPKLATRPRLKRRFVISFDTSCVKVASKILAALLLGCAAAVAFPLLANAAPGKAPSSTCTIGTYLQGLHDLNFADKTFQAELWLWANCVDQNYEPLRHL